MAFDQVVQQLWESKKTVGTGGIVSDQKNLPVVWKDVLPGDDVSYHCHHATSVMFGPLEYVDEMSKM